MKNELMDVDLNESSLPASENNLAKAETGIESNARLKVLELAILGFLKDLNREIIEREIFEGVIGRRQSKLRAIGNLLDEGIVRRSGTGKKGDPYKYSYDQPKIQFPSIELPSDSMTESEKQNVVELFQLLLRMKQKSPKGIGT